MRLSFYDENQNTVPKIYNFPYFDNSKIYKNPFIMSINGKENTLKTRFCLYLAKNLIKSGRNVLFISSSSEYLKFLSLELGDTQNQIILGFSNSIEELVRILEVTPKETHVFIDSIISVYTDNPNWSEKQYLFLGKVIKYWKEVKSLYFYLATPISGFNHKPVSDVFDDFITYQVAIKKISGPKKINKTLPSGDLARVIDGYYYSICVNKSQRQLIFVSMNKGLNTKIIQFFWCFKKGIIKKIRKSYYLDTKRLGTDINTIVENNSFKHLV